MYMWTLKCDFFQKKENDLNENSYFIGNVNKYFIGCEAYRYIKVFILFSIPVLKQYI